VLIATVSKQDERSIIADFQLEAVYLACFLWDNSLGSNSITQQLAAVSVYCWFTAVTTVTWYPWIIILHNAFCSDVFMVQVQTVIWVTFIGLKTNAISQHVYKYREHFWPETIIVQSSESSAAVKMNLDAKQSSCNAIPRQQARIFVILRKRLYYKVIQQSYLFIGIYWMRAPAVFLLHVSYKELKIAYFLVTIFNCLKVVTEDILLFTVNEMEKRNTA
jgi:hypothetical protein